MSISSDFLFYTPVVKIPGLKTKAKTKLAGVTWHKSSSVGTVTQ